MITREATPEDVAAVAALLGEMRDSTVQPETITAQFSMIVNDKNRTVLLIEDGGTVYGSAVITLICKLPKITAWIDEVIVSAAARGRGYGKELMKACESWAWEHDAYAIEFTSRPSREAANALYQKMDYQLRETNVYQKKKDETWLA
ncbi:MAG TPA: GNAT family N-acetyltransferase [Candidatus Saccharimonadales bacterium]